MKYISGVVTAFLAVAVLLLPGCDNIEEPYLENVPDSTGGPPGDAIKKILIEDYTGFLCNNCPVATEIAEEIKQAFPEQVVIMAVHAGEFAEPFPSGKFSYDFRTLVGDRDLDGFFKISAAGLPKGMVNRVKVNGVRALDKDQWAAVASEFVGKDPVVSIQLQNTYDPVTRTLDVVADVEYLQDADTDNHLVLYLLEDNFVQYQKDKRHDPQDLPDYVHQHVLRDGITVTWGDRLSPDGSIPAGTQFRKEYTYVLSEEWEDTNCKVVAFIHKFGTTYEVLQAEEKKIIED